MNDLDTILTATKLLSALAAQPRLRTSEATLPSEQVDVDRAVRLNANAARWLFWSAHRAAIERLVGAAAGDDRALARGVGAWQVANGLAEDGVLGPCTWARMRNAVGAGPESPCVTATRFRTAGATDGDNCCGLCPQNLGVGVDSGAGPTASNGMELRFTLRHLRGFEYDITRTRGVSIFERRAGAWTRLFFNAMGTTDDLHNADECLTPTAAHQIFAMDQPGWGTVLPAAAGTQFGIPGGAVTAADATDVVLRANFAEWVIARNRAAGTGWLRISMPVWWHTITWLRRDGAGRWINDARSEIARGALRMRDVRNHP